MHRAEVPRLQSKEAYIPAHFGLTIWWCQLPPSRRAYDNARSLRADHGETRREIDGQAANFKNEPTRLLQRCPSTLGWNLIPCETPGLCDCTIIRTSHCCTRPAARATVQLDSLHGPVQLRFLVPSFLLPPSLSFSFLSFYIPFILLFYFFFLPCSFFSSFLFFSSFIFFSSFLFFSFVWWIGRKEIRCPMVVHGCCG